MPSFWKFWVAPLLLLVGVTACADLTHGSYTVTCYSGGVSVKEYVSDRVWYSGGYIRFDVPSTDQYVVATMDCIAESRR